MKKQKKLSKSVVVLLLTLILGILLIFTFIRKINFGLDLKGGFEVLYLVEGLQGEKLTDEDIKGAYKSIRNRIDTLGVSEPEIIIEGEKIRVKLPGVQDEN